MRWRAVLLFLGISAASVGCNHLFYYPDRHQRLQPSRVKIAYDDVTMATADGQTLHGWWLKTNAKRRGVVVHFHGNAENISSHFLFSAWLTRYGFDVLVFDYRGYGRSTGTPDRKGLVLDGKTALDFAVARAPDAPLFVLGQSIGGAVALPAAFERQERLSALILDSTFGSYRGIARDKLDSFWLTWPLQIPLSFLVTEELRPLDFAASFTRPVLVLHAKDDPIVPYERGRELFDAFPAADKEFWEVEGKGHVAAFAIPADTYREKLVQFLKQNLPKPGIITKTPPHD